MDYVSGVDNILMAARLKYAPLSYDKMAMDWAYSADDKALDDKVSRYCTDDDIALANSQGLQVYGCERFDAGNNPLYRKYLSAKTERDSFVKVLFASVIGRLYPADDPNSIADLETVLQDTLKWGQLGVEEYSFITGVVMETSVGTGPSPSFASLENVKNGSLLNSKLGMDSALVKERQRSLAELGGYAFLLNSMWRNSDGTLALDWLEQQIADLKRAPYLAKGKTLAGREYELTPAQQQAIIEFLESLKPLNQKVLAKGLTILLPRFKEPQQMANGTVAIVTSILPQNLLNENEATVLAQLYADLLKASTSTKTVKVGPILSKDLVVPVPFLSLEERTSWMKLLSSEGLQFNMELKKALLRQEQYDKVNAFLKEIEPTLDLKTVTKPEDLPAVLLGVGVVDNAAFEWLKVEISVLVALTK